MKYLLSLFSVTITITAQENYTYKKPISDISKGFGELALGNPGDAIEAFLKVNESDSLYGLAQLNLFIAYKHDKQY